MSEINPNLPPPLEISTPDATWPIDSASTGISDYRVPRGRSGRSIGALRSSGSRSHAGIDLFGKHRDVVRAITSGQILSFYYFYRSTFALVIDHGDFVVNYSEVDADSLHRLGLKTPRYKPTQRHPMLTESSRTASQYSVLSRYGSLVVAGQPIATVGKMFRSSMLHIEFYESGTIYNKKWQSGSGSPPSGLLDGTDYLLNISQRKTMYLTPQKEATPKAVICR